MINIRLFFLVILLSLSSPSVLSKQKQVYLVGTYADDFVSSVIFDKVSSELGIELEYVTFSSFSESLDAVRNGYIDFMANVTYTKDRSEWFEFSEPTNLEFSYIFSRDGITKFSRNHTVGVMKKTIYSEVLPQEFPDTKFLLFSDLAEASELMIAGEVDAVVGPISFLNNLLSQGFEAHSIKNSYFAYPTSVISKKGKNRDRLNEIQQLLLSQDFQKHLNRELEQFQRLTRKQSLRKRVIRNGLNISSQIHINMNLIGHHFNNKNKDDVINDITSDIIDDACYVLNLKCNVVNVNNMDITNFDEDLFTSNVNVIAPVEVNNERSKVMHFSDPIYSQNTIFVKRVGYNENNFTLSSHLFDEKIGVLSDSYHRAILSVIYPGKELNLYSTYDTLVNALINGDVDYIYMNRSTLNHIYSNSSDILQIEEESKLANFYNYDIALAFPMTEQGKLLSKLFSDAIELVDVTKIIEKYDLPPDWYETIKWQREIRRRGLISFFAITALLLSFLLFFYKKSLTDELTKLNNRLALYKKYGKKIKSSYSIVYLDVNKFKYINDNFGHDYGDKVLVKIGRRIKEHWQGQGYRVGGDEFVLLYKGNPENIESMLKEITEIKIFIDDIQQFHNVTLSVGISETRLNDMPLDQALQEADKLMFSSKANFRREAR